MLIYPAFVVVNTYQFSSLDDVIESLMHVFRARTSAFW